MMNLNPKKLVAQKKNTNQVFGSLFQEGIFGWKAGL